jgi:2-keto-3-deoxy-galactonokinase
VRTLDLTGAQEKSDGLEYLSGIIIGHDIGAQLRKPSQYVGVVASSPLARKYQIALEALGHSSIIIESQAATINGALAINEHLLAASKQASKQATRSMTQHGWHT